MRQITATGQTVDDAVQSALQQLNTTRDQVNIEIIDEGKKGILGLFGSKRAIVKVTLAPSHLKVAETYLQDIARHMGVDVKVTTTTVQNTITFDLSGDKIALLIGKRGQTLNGIQYLLQLIVNRNAKDYYTVVVDAEGYRDRRKQTLETLANRMAEKAISTRRSVTLEPMPSYERKVIHTALQDRTDISTSSEGTEPNRHVVIHSS
ncbi:RNA-binding cell elongation regulator Jag/EloR [Radiobacillus deserti]|uniref:RNA-binding protein KhpB n=1 Tax=Radiobacillus deserti TaxID=2594883 RepID=A0A516KKW2_9BACI|nr:RNA-binding cell elongation regulator Jag/EloR [Radiobacillus deserti]QDP42025.1 protein jag [Radiobacillus deserti]